MAPSFGASPKVYTRRAPRHPVAPAVGGGEDGVGRVEAVEVAAGGDPRLAASRRRRPGRRLEDPVALAVGGGHGRGHVRGLDPVTRSGGVAEAVDVAGVGHDPVAVPAGVGHDCDRRPEHPPMPGHEPAKWASPKAKTPPSEATMK